MKKSKIKRIESIKPYTNDHGTTEYHNLEMENGDKINIGKKKQQQVGWELIYQIVDSGQEYNKAKSVSQSDFEKSNGNSSNSQNIRNQSVQDSILYQSTMKEVMSYFNVHGFPNGEESVEDRMSIISDTCIFLAKKSKENILEM